ncbi:MAG: tetratricopeptide repeat protein, partial [Candidatus Binatia bacterium]
MLRLRTLILPALLCVFLPLACARSPEEQKARHLTRAERYFGDGDFGEAIIEYRNVLKLDPDNALAVRRLGLAHHELGELRQSFAYLLRARELDSGDVETRLKLAGLYLAGREAGEARTEALSVLKDDPDSFEALLLLGAAATTPEEVDQAIERLESARGRFGDRAKLHIALGSLYLQRSDVEKAKRSFEEAVSREPKAVEPRVAMGEYHLRRNDLEGAEREFRAA